VAYEEWRAMKNRLRPAFFSCTADGSAASSAFLSRAPVLHHAHVIIAKAGIGHLLIL
jgi:hypothetical protein